MFKEFKEFISKGNVMDLAIGVIIGGAFSDIVSALTSSFIQPLLALIGGAEVKGTIPLGNSGQALDYGAFLTAVINFLIVAFVLFIMVKAINTANKKSKEKLEAIAAKVKKGEKVEETEVQSEPETKLCKYCLSEISYKATRCPHCTSVLDEEEAKKIADELSAAIKEDKENPISIMIDSGARGNLSNLNQMSGMRGLMMKPTGEAVEIPITSSFSEGANVSEFFLATHGARKGAVDTALKTADAGYLTRRLVDVAHDIIVKEDDCGTEQGVVVEAFMNEKDNTQVESLRDRIVGRYTSKKIINPETKEVMYDKDTYITEAIADKIVEAGITKVSIRTVLTCKTEHGVCRKCYGRNLATGSIVEIGEAVGIMAAQSIGEPGTQLTMRTINSGGVAGDDITQGLPRVQELFEARNPKGKANIAEITGKITKIEEDGGKYIINITNDAETREHVTNYSAKLAVELNQEVKAGQRLTHGAISPKELLVVTDPITVQQYILLEIQKVYRSQGVDISDKHVEVMAKRMISKIKIVNSGDTLFLPGTLVNINEFSDVNKKLIIEGKRPATGRPVLLCITKASLETDSFLSAASFQETTRILTDAAIHGRVDHLNGLKENVIIGKLIPAGTGAREYRNIDYKLEAPEITEEPLDMLEDELLA